MVVRYLKPFTKDFKKLPKVTKKKVWKQVALLTKDLSHPSLNAQKMKGQPDIWEAQIDYQYRTTFNIQKNTVIMRRVGTHKIYKQP